MSNDPLVETVHDCAASSSPSLQSRARSLSQSAQCYASLLKPRILVLLLSVSLATGFLAARGIPRLSTLVLLLVTGSLAAGGAGALNHYLECDLDGLMARTRNRPLVSGQIANPAVALWLGLSFVLLATAIAIPASTPLAFFLFAGAFVYVVIYTLWLKRRSSWNIVIGGASGSCAVLAGWTAVEPVLTAQPLLLALLLFLWTPAHFWSLAIDRIDDYRRAGLPMLPVVVGPKTTAYWILLHVLLVVGVSLALTAIGDLGPIYSRIALVAGTVFVVVAVWLVTQPVRKVARLHFVVSNLYLVAVLVGMVLDISFQA